MLNHNSDSPHYYLTEHTYLAVLQDSIVLLDAKTDRYLQLTPELSLALEKNLALTLPDPSRPTYRATNSFDCQRCKKDFSSLIHAGVITEDKTRGKHAAILKCSSSIIEAPAVLPHERPGPNKRDMANFLYAYVTTFGLIKGHGLYQTLRHLKQQRLHRSTNGDDFAPNKAIEVVETFKSLKPLLIAVKDQCLFNSILLVRFLALYGIFTDLWIGVRTNPFSAHAWTQHQNMLLDDFIYNVSGHVPIMTTQLIS